MGAINQDRSFAGSIPQIYEKLLVPLIFEPYARDLTARAKRLKPSRVLEIAAGTGAVTRHLARELAKEVAIVATDLNQAMIDQAAASGTSRPVEWKQADAMKLPFPDQSFDLIVCQFGVMFFPEKPVAMAEARRVLKPGGTFLFNVWDRLETNDFAELVTHAVAKVFPVDPPSFLARTPHGYCDHAVIAKDLAAGGFDAKPAIDTVTAEVVASSPRDPAVGFCQGTPLRMEIEARDPAKLAAATDAAAAAVRAKFGDGRVTGRLQAVVTTVKRG